MAENEKVVALLPLDNRPVSYLLPKQIADFSGINLILPERKYLGDLKKGCDLNYIEKWLKDIVGVLPAEGEARSQSERHATPLKLIISLDTWIYGGLVQSRKHNLSLDELRSRIDLLKGLINKTQTYSFSSIMRIPNYNSDEEEKPYWKDYGEKIFKWSELMYRVGRGITRDKESNEELIEKWYQSSKEIPPDILADYKAHRDTNFTVNMFWLESLHENTFEYLILSCDDSSKYGMNVVEAEFLEKYISRHNFLKKVKVLSGTDEILLVLMTRTVLSDTKYKPSVSLYFNSEQGKNQTARYESKSIHDSVLNQLDAIGIETKDYKEADITLFIHCADSVQGDHVFGIKPDDTSVNAVNLIKEIEKTNKPFIILDLAYANGADPNLIEILLSSKINWSKCYGYAGWNTCSNTTGSALSIGINRWIAEKENRFNEESFKKCLLTRFLDDYVYQSIIRNGNIIESDINNKMKSYTNKFLALLELKDIGLKFKLPWQRSFEIETIGF